MRQLRVLLADDHAVFRGGVRALIDPAPGLELAGEATTGDEAVERATSLQPDVVVMDMRMPGLSGIEATRQIAVRSPHVGIVILTMLANDDCVIAAIRAGARGYLLKGCDPEEIIRAIQAVGSGEAIFGPPIANRLADLLADPRDPSAADSARDA